MDGLIARFDAVADDDLMLCEKRGVAYQRNMDRRLPPGMNAAGENYFDHYAKVEGNETAVKIHRARVELVNSHVGSPFEVCDIGIGSGEFIKSRPHTHGYDVNPLAVDWLKRKSLWCSSLTDYKAFTFWDVLEHVPAPNDYFRRIKDGSFLFTSLPIFGDLNSIRKSKHYKPGEHLYYWTKQGLIDWMAYYRFRLLETRTAESDAGRDSVLSFAFVRDLPGYHDTVDQYRKLYEPNYGASAYLYFDQVAKEVLALDPKSILDFGCGRSDLASYFWADGRRRIAKYDPAISQFSMMPEGGFDLTICCDVMEHILLHDVDRILETIRTKSRKALFTISMKPARKKLPDGRNAHVSLLSVEEWTRWIKSYFGKAVRIPVHDDQILMLKTY